MGHIVDRIEALLDADEPVPTELAADLLATMPREERERWLRILLDWSGFRPPPAAGHRPG